MSTPDSNVSYYAHHTAGGMTQKISIGDNGTMPAYGDTVVFEAWVHSGGATGSLVIKLVP